MSVLLIVGFEHVGEQPTMNSKDKFIVATRAGGSGDAAATGVSSGPGMLCPLGLSGRKKPTMRMTLIVATRTGRIHRVGKESSMEKAKQKTVRVLAALNHREPDRVPIGEWWANMEEVFHCE